MSDDKRLRCHVNCFGEIRELSPILGHVFVLEYELAKSITGFLNRRH